MEKQEKSTINRSEEVKDIIEKMPTGFVHWVSIAVLIFTALLLLFGWIIKYPDTVTGQIKINSDRTLIKLVANSSGKLNLFDLRTRDTVKENEYIAVIQNSANTDDVKKVAELITQFDPNRNSFLESKNLFPEKVSLGELNLKYYTFLTALKNKYHYEQNNPYDQQRKSLLEDIRWEKSILNQTNEAVKTLEEKMEITQKWYEKDASLNKREVIHDQELDRTKSDYLSAIQNVQSIKKEVSSIGMQIANSHNKLSQLMIEQREKEKQMQLDLLSSYHDLNDNIKMWEQKYVFKAPFDGQVEFLKFWANNQFIGTGEEVFSIVPQETKIIGQVFLPSSGAGKVVPGSKVSIKLDNYPYMEFGSVEGIVNSISLTTRQEQGQQGNINTYLVLVDLPQGLTTNYGEKLSFKYEIGGVADIIIRDRQLIQRLFDNLKYRTKGK